MLEHKDFVLEKTDDWQITHLRPRDTNPGPFPGKVLVGFGEIGSGIDSVGFGETFAKKNNIEYVKVSQRKYTQYQSLSREDFEQILNSPSLQGKSIYLYGASLGGYCALYYGRSVEANILALSPRIPAHPLISRLMTIKFKNEGFRHRELYDGHPRENGTSRRHVLYDASNFVDSFYVETSVKQAYSDVRLHHVDGAGHYSPMALAVSGQLKSTLTNYLADKDLTFNIDSNKIIDWHKIKVSEFIKSGKLNKAVEHLTALIGRIDDDSIFELTENLNSSFKR